MPASPSQDRTAAARGPLAGVRVVELGGIGPAPFAALLLADLGADVLRIDRIVPSDSGVDMPTRFHLINRGRRSVAMDLKNADARRAVLRLAARADALIEGFRPGVAERLGLGPDDCQAVNPKLVYGRVTGWGQEGPLASTPGHDINYIALSGVLHSIGRRDAPPTPPLNLAGDFAGGSLYLALGVVSALLEARNSGRGQVVDAAMVDGSASLMTLMYGMHAAGLWSDRRGDNRLDSGTPWYDVYETRDGRYVSIGSNEPRFYDAMLERMGLAQAGLPDRNERANWPELRERFAAVFRQKTRDEWCAIMQGSEACFAPVLSMAEAPAHAHNAQRRTFVEVDGVPQPGPAPRFSRTPGAIRCGPPAVGQHTDEALADWGIEPAEIQVLRNCGAVA